MKAQLTNSVKSNLKWFRQSGIMRPEDGFWGVAERIAAVPPGCAREQIDKSFHIQTPIDENTVILEHRRADCCAETAMMFELAAQAFDNPEYHEIAVNIVDFMTKRSGLRVMDEDSPKNNLWRWAMPDYKVCWTDDNSWVTICLLFLAENSFPELKSLALATAEAIFRHMEDYITYMENGGREKRYEAEVMAGSLLNPHWMGLVTIALSWAYAHNRNSAYYNLIKRYYGMVNDGPPEYDVSSSVKNSEYKWSVSEYAYLTLAGSIAARTFEDASFKELAQNAADILLKKQFATGHFASNHYEAPEGEHFADLIYTQNWATLGLQHIALLFPERTFVRGGSSP